MLRIFHVPSHLTYVAKLTGPEFAPVPSPVGQPLWLSELVALDSWDFFDVLHRHTVELAAGDEIERIASRATCADKRLVFTAHDLVPNIETDGAIFGHKTTRAARHAAAVITLTGIAGQQLTNRLSANSSPVRVVPHGAALPLPFVGTGGEGTGVAALGALRPNRDHVGLARAWRRLPQPRPVLRVLVRSLTKADRQHYATVLAEHTNMSHTEPGFTITLTTEMLAPDVPTLHAQLADGPPCEAAWFPPQTLHQPERFAGYLQHALSLPPRVRRSAHVGPPSISGSSMLTPTCISLPFQRKM